MKEPITSLNVAEYFLSLANAEDKKISNKKLQKLVYYAQAWTLALTEKPLFLDRIEAWIHGPAIPSLYKKFKKYRFNPIKDASIDKPCISDTEILDEVWRVYGRYDADYLELLTHQEDPWIHARDELEFGEFSNNEISHDAMKEYYRSKLENSKNYEPK